MLIVPVVAVVLFPFRDECRKCIKIRVGFAEQMPLGIIEVHVGICKIDCFGGHGRVKVPVFLGGHQLSRLDGRRARVAGETISLTYRAGLWPSQVRRRTPSSY